MPTISKLKISALFLSLIYTSTTSVTFTSYRTLTVYYHDIRYNGTNFGNATSAIIGSPGWANRTALTDLVAPLSYGDLIVFDNPITLDPHLLSPPVARAQGMYLYDGKTNLAAWFSFTMIFNSTDYKGTINFAGADIITLPTRDISVIGGTGDFFLARGIATLSEGALTSGDDYFRFRIDITLYE